MRGFMMAALGLVALDVMLRSPVSRVSSAFTIPTVWLAEWMDPRTPLIPAKPAPAAKRGSASSPSPGYLQTALGPVPLNLIQALP